MWFKHLKKNNIVNENIPINNDKTFLGASNTSKTYMVSEEEGGSQRGVV